MGTHWKSLTNPNYLGSYAFEDNQDLVCTIKKVQNEVVTGDGGRKEECTVCYFAEEIKPMILNKTNMKTIAKLTGSPYIENWVNKQIQIYVDPKVKFGKDITGGLRIRPKAPIAEEVYKCSNCGNVIRPASNMTPKQISVYTANKYGQALCSKCASARLKELNANETAE